MRFDIAGYNYDFETTSLITELSLKATKPTGKVLARVRPSIVGST